MGGGGGVTPFVQVSFRAHPYGQRQCPRGAELQPIGAGPLTSAVMHLGPNLA